MNQDAAGGVVLVTGVSRYLGGRLARLLAAEPGTRRVIGVDVVPPRFELPGVEFVRADIRNPVIGKVIAATGVDTVVHMNVIATPASAGGRSSMKEINVIGTMQLLAACQKASTVKKLVIKSSTAIYGAGPKDPAMFSEDAEPRSVPRTGFAKDSVEVEGYVRGFARRRPDVTVTMLRFANCIGPNVNTPMTDYFLLPVVPTGMGFDARMQFIHEEDLLEAIRQVTHNDHPGTFNVAGDGVLPLSQALRLAGRLSIPVPLQLMSPLGRWVRNAGVADFSAEQVQFLTYGRAVDTTRMRTELGFEPRYTTQQAFEDVIAARGLRPLVPADRIRRLEQDLVAVLTGRTVGNA